MGHRVVTLVGNPKPRSRTLHAAQYLASELVPSAAPAIGLHTIDLAVLGSALLDRSDQTVAGLVERTASADLLVVATPTYKASYTGLLKLFLDRLPAGSLRDVIAVPLMLGGAPGHALAVDHTLHPLLLELGACVPARGIYVLDSGYDDPAAYTEWLDMARPRITALLDAKAVAAR